MSIRQDVSDILGFQVPPMGYKKKFEQLDRQGVISQKALIKILVLLLEREEERENNIQPTE